jgi:alkanesulfonate monooxygenase SsuD/methylene tetrahydromethanopterin reductase-like flavin-dependent oxidoreductase (luciferase family)
MKFGVFDHMDDAGVPLAQLYENRLRLTQAYERAGIYAYHVAEHHATPLGMAASPGIYLSAVAQRTKTLRFGPMVYLLPFYHPIRLIEEICMLDQMSGGRLQLGVGRGVVPREAQAYDIDFNETGKMYHEAFQVLMKGLSSEELTFAGAYYKFNGVPMLFKPVQRPHPPLWYGLVFPDQATWPAANDVNIIMLGMRPDIRAIVERYHAERAKNGKNPNNVPMIGVMRHVFVAPTDAEALRIARRAYLVWAKSFYWIWDTYKEDPHIRHIYPATFDEVMAIGNGVAGSPETVRKYIAAEAEATGINYFVSWFAFGDLTIQESLHSLELFSREVMPAFVTKQAAE